MTGIQGSAITGVGTYLPARMVGNEELSGRTSVTPEWIEERTGIRTRHFSGEDEDVAAMAVEAGKKAIAAASVDPAEIDLVVLATATRHQRIPGAAAQVAFRIGLPAAGAFDVNAVCAGFAYALAQASNAVKVGDARNVLVIGADQTSGMINPDRADTYAIFGDGAGAVVVSRDVEQSIGPVVWGSDGARATALETLPENGDEAIFMNGPAVYKWSTSTMPKVAALACERAGTSLAEIDWFIPHQANLRIIDTLIRLTGIPAERVSRDVIEMGNTSGASIPLAFGRLHESGRAQPGDRVLLLGFGAGLTYAGQVVRMP
ncbi:beta-ketoacyl-ACP synthase III [Actinomadura rubrisoli]|uniref:Ketoacyl-ACP synthase III n=1 Tax=Actinomadura rubrisoli TaxID=2530368 RepID=A0A4R5C9F0_9ACTN|nr:beta-ketoacyl-ACP synthase III [Actinomadura rubrisoli]TDD94820.1 ketoacyl-ACP synthase III [Actinomadura rubrisoli]